jgi:hypothetical protein
MEELTLMLSGSGIYGVEGSRLLPEHRRYASYLFCGSLQRRRSRGGPWQGPTVTLQMLESSPLRRRPLYSLHCEIANYMRRAATQGADRWERRLERSSRIVQDDVDARIRGSRFRFIFLLSAGKRLPARGYP